MNYNKLEQVQKTLNQLSIVIESLNSEQHSLIDFDLSLAKTRVLYEQLTDLKLEQLSSKPSSIEADKVIIKPEPAKEEKISEQIDQEALKYIEEKENIDAKNNTDVSFQEVETEMVEMEENTAEEITDENIEFVDELSYEKIVEEEIVEEEKTEIKATNPQINENSETVADKFEDKESLNDILSSIKNDEDFATQLQNRPIKDLKTAISLNDKIWFTRELFDGNNDNFLTSVEILNNSRSIEEAIEIADTYGWDQKESSTKRFLELIYRRFV